MAGFAASCDACCGVNDTTRGKGDPVALAQTLADTAKAAAGNPVTLESLLRGGGMDQVLKVMPANASLKDVVDALAKGGLPAAVEVVYPTPPAPVVPPTPSANMKLAFYGVTQGKGDTTIDHVTSKDVVDVVFSYTGNSLRSGQYLEYTINGEKWIRVDAVQNIVTKLITIAGIDLSKGEPVVKFGVTGDSNVSNGNNSSSNTNNNNNDDDDDDDNSDDDDSDDNDSDDNDSDDNDSDDTSDTGHADLLTHFQLRAVDAGGKTFASASQVLVYDHHAAAPMVQGPKHADLYLGNNVDHLTNTTIFKITGDEAGALVEYTIEAGQGANQGTEKTWYKDMPVLDDGQYTIGVRQTDLAGNVSAVKSVTFKLDTKVPGDVTISLKTDTGASATDGLTNNSTMLIEGLDQSGDTGWQYSTDGGVSWTFGAKNTAAGSNEFDLDLLPKSASSVVVRQIDMAGNVSKNNSAALPFTLDKSAPAGEFTFQAIENATQSSASETALQFAKAYFEFTGTPAETDQFQYKLDEGDWQDLDSGAFDSDTNLLTVSGIDFTSKDHKLSVRLVDAAGNANTSLPTSLDSTYNNVPRATMDAIGPLFSNASAKLKLTVKDATATTTTTVTSVADATTLSLKSMSTGVAVDVNQNYFDGPNFKVAGGTLTFGAVPEIDLYQFGWTDKSFKTSNQGGLVEAGKELFVAGKVGTVVLEGFAIDSIVEVKGDISHSSTSRVNNAFIAEAGTVASIYSGDGHDFIAVNGAKLTIAYDKLDQTAYDVVKGFQTGHDKIKISGEIADRMDDDKSGLSLAEWGTYVEDKYTPTAGIEAVKLVNLPLSLSSDALVMGNSLKALNLALNVQNFKTGDDLLLLATYEEQSILLAYVEKSVGVNGMGNGKIDANELTFLAIFDQGVVDIGDIDLVGATPPVVGP